MTSKEKDPEWLQCQTKEYRVGKDGLRDVVEEMDCDGKLRQWFPLVDHLEEMDIGDGIMPRPTYVNTDLTEEKKDKVHLLAHEFIDCFAWEYTEMPGLSRDLVEHRLSIK
jgi:hypothetical protein